MLRDETIRCPVCDERGLAARGRQLVCEGCQGALVPEDHLREMIAEAKTLTNTDEPTGDIALVLATTTEAGRTCPRCTVAMAKHELMSVTVDRCAAHGIWFDRDELAKVLHRQGLIVVAEREREAARSSVVLKMIRVALLIFFLLIAAVAVAALIYTVAIGPHKAAKHPRF